MNEQGFITVSCGACGRDLKVTREQWENDNVADCPDCPDGGADLAHARRHADEPTD